VDEYEKINARVIFWYEILQHRLEHLLEDYKYNSNSFDHDAVAGRLQFLKHTIAVSVWIFVVSSMISYSWDLEFSFLRYLLTLFLLCIS